MWVAADIIKETNVARYLGPKAKLSRREGADLLLKSARRSISDKAKFDSKPGQHGRTSGQRTSDFGLQLREKQKVKRTYGVLENQFRRYFEAADRQKGITGELLLQSLERRLDNVVYRVGFATSRAQARQLVRHGHFLVNGKKVDIPSYSLKAGDVVTVRQTSRTNPAILHAVGEVKGRGIPEWIALEGELGAKVASIPTRAQINLPVQEQLIVELYSK